ncbi:MAG: M1 family aminopeptidase [Terriglobia bacterium]
MVLRFTDSTYEEITRERKPKTGPINSAAADLLHDHRKFLRKGKTHLHSNIALAFQRYNLDARILQDLTWLGQSGIFMAYFDGKKYGETLYGIDPLGAPFVTPEEVVLVNFSERALGIWAASHLSSHYQNGIPMAESHELIDFLHHEINATPKGKSLEATVRTRFKAKVSGARVLDLDLYPALRMKNVTDEAGKSLGFIQEDKDEDADFYILLPEELKEGQEYTLQFSYAGDDAVRDSGGGNYTLVARTDWYPNSAFTDRATYDLTLNTPKDLLLVATGIPGPESKEKDRLVTHWKSDIPLAVAGFNYGKFKKTAVQDEKINCLIESYANKDLPDFLKTAQHGATQSTTSPVTGSQTVGSLESSSTLGSLNTTAMMNQSRAEAQAAMGIYTNYFGGLPYGRLAMTQQPFMNFGQAWPMLVYMPLTAYLDYTYRHELGFDDPKNFFKVVAAHEVAHQWWGHLIGWKSYRDQWMSEGFADFSASLFAQAVYKDDTFLKFWRDERQLILQKNASGMRPADIGSVIMGYRLDTALTENATRSLIYPKGAFILHMLRMMMWDSQSGDARFMTMMKDFVKTYYNSNVSTEDFFQTVSKHMTKEMDLAGDHKMDWFVREWVYGNQIPEYRLEYTIDTSNPSQIKLTGKITQSNVDSSFRMRVPMYLDLDGKLVRLGSTALLGNTTTPEFSIPLPRKPKRALLCAYEDILCTIKD